MWPFTSRICRNIIQVFSFRMVGGWRIVILAQFCESYKKKNTEQAVCPFAGPILINMSTAIADGQHDMGLLSRFLLWDEFHSGFYSPAEPSFMLPWFFFPLFLWSSAAYTKSHYIPFYFFPLDCVRQTASECMWHTHTQHQTQKSRVRSVQTPMI